MSDILFEILICLIMAAGIAVFRVVWPAIKKEAEIVEANLQESNHALAATIIREAVSAIEQTAKDIKGGDKKQAAVDLIQKGLAEYNIELTDDEIDRMIEAFVGDMNRNE